MQSLLDFLSFKFFISSYVLIICYYMGALSIPVASWFLVRWFRSKFSLASGIYESGKKQITHQLTNSSHRVLLAVLFIVFFICMEVIWRMIFEFLIAYFQIRETIMDLAIQ